MWGVGRHLGWVAAEWVAKGKPSVLGVISGAVAGLVAITPASGFVLPGPALIIGVVAGVVCFWSATGLKHLLGYDDSLDAFGVHGIGGIVGALLTGVFAYGPLSATDASPDGTVGGLVRLSAVIAETAHRGREMRSAPVSVLVPWVRALSSGFPSS